LIKINILYSCAGIVLKLLRQISQETEISVDEVKVQFPIKSKDYVSKRRVKISK